MDQIGGEPLLFGFCSISIGEEWDVRSP